MPIRLELQGYSPEQEPSVRAALRSLLSAYGGTSLYQVLVNAPEHRLYRQGMPQLVQTARFWLREDWRLTLYSRNGGEDWALQQSCPRCGGGCRWEPVSPGFPGKEEPMAVLSCGGCGLALARPETGVVEQFSVDEHPRSLPRQSLVEQFEQHYCDPLRAVLEAEEIAQLCLLIAAYSEGRGEAADLHPPQGFSCQETGEEWN